MCHRLCNAGDFNVNTAVGMAPSCEVEFKPSAQNYYCDDSILTRTAAQHEHISNVLWLKKGSQDAGNSDCCCLYSQRCSILCIVKPCY